jgi:hypothetical protein
MRRCARTESSAHERCWWPELIVMDADRCSGWKWQIGRVRRAGKNFLLALKARGLRGVILAVGDDHPGLKRVIMEGPCDTDAFCWAKEERH